MLLEKLLLVLCDCFLVGGFLGLFCLFDGPLLLTLLLVGCYLVCPELFDSPFVFNFLLTFFLGVELLDTLVFSKFGGKVAFELGLSEGFLAFPFFVEPLLVGSGLLELSLLPLNLVLLLLILPLSLIFGILCT